MLRPGRSRGRSGTELQKRRAWLVVLLAAGWWAAKRGVPAASSTTGRVGRCGLRRAVGAWAVTAEGAKTVGRWH